MLPFTYTSCICWTNKDLIKKFHVKSGYGMIVG